MGCFYSKPPPKRDPFVSPGDSSSSTLPRTESEERPTAEVPGTLRQFSQRELQHATQRFASANLLGEGGFGKVYRGSLGTTQVAVKVCNLQGFQGPKEFTNELLKLSVLDSVNIVRLIGFSIEGNMALVYPLYPNGSLDRLLFTSERPALTWSARVKIALGLAQGLYYLHRNKVIHRDLKPSNVLMEDDLTPVLADFGMAHDGPETGQTHVSTVIMGSLGYLDPHYWETTQLTYQTDVYALGVIMLELLTGAKEKEVHLVDWVRRWAFSNCCNEHELRLKMDPRLHDQFPIHSAVRLALLAKHCVMEKPGQRYPLTNVVAHLQRELRKA